MEDATLLKGRVALDAIHVENLGDGHPLASVAIAAEVQDSTATSKTNMCVCACACVCLCVSVCVDSTAKRKSTDQAGEHQSCGAWQRRAGMEPM